MPPTDFSLPPDRKKSNKNTAELYDYPLDCLAEPIQNSFRSIELRQKEDEGHEGLITVRVNTKQKQITIIDNGKGFVAFDKSLQPSTSGWHLMGGKETAEAGFGNGLTSLIIMSDKAEINSATTDGLTRRILFEDSYKSHYGTKKQQSKPFTAKIHDSPKKSAHNKRVETKIVLKGKEKAYRKLWEMIDVDFAMKEKNEGVDAFEMLEGALLWHTALGWSKTLWGADAPNIKYKLELTSTKVNGGKKKETNWKDVGHPLSKLPTGYGTFNVLRNKPKNKPMPLPKSDDILIARRVFDAAKAGKPAEGARLRVFALTMVGDDQSVTEKMKDNFPQFPMYHYNSERYFVSINGYNQALKQSKPSGTAGNLAIHNNAIFIYDLEIKPSKLKVNDILEPGRNRFKPEIKAYSDPLIENHAVKKLDKFQKGGKKVNYLNDITIYDAARNLCKELPWKKTSENLDGFESDLGFANLHRKPSDENWVASVFGAFLGAKLVNEIRLIIIGHNNDTYDLVFWNDLPADQIPKKAMKGLVIPKPLAGKKHSDSNIPVFGEVKMNTRDFCLDIDGEKTRKDPTKVKYLVCWKASESNNHPEDWVLKRKKIGDVGLGLVRCSTHTLIKSISGKSSIKMNVLSMSDYLKCYEEEKSKYDQEVEKHKKDPKKNKRPAEFVWPPESKKWW